MKPSEIWKEIKPRIGEMLVAVNDIETRADKAQEEAYQRGLNDAWECVDKINSMSHKEQEECFGRTYLVNILELEPSECIEKIRAYEQEKEEGSRLRRSIKNVMSACDCSLDDIAEALQKMKKS